jgi:hypothetical protein
LDEKNNGKRKYKLKKRKNISFDQLIKIAHFNEKERKNSSILKMRISLHSQIFFKIKSSQKMYSILMDRP